MKSFASNLINTIFKRISARPAAARRRATLGFEPLEMRAVLSTVMPSPTTAADDVVVDGHVITGENYDSPRSGGGGGGAGKVSMRDLQYGASIARTSAHPGGVNVLLGDGSVRFLRDSVSTLGTWAAAETRTGTHGSGGGAGKVAMQDFHFSLPSAGDDRFSDIIVGAGVGPAGHVKVFDGIAVGQLDSFFAAHPGGVNAVLGDGSVRFVSDSVPTLTSWAAGAGTRGSGGGAGKVAMQDFHFSLPSAGDDRFDDIIVGAGVGPAGHVKVFDGTRGGELASFYAFGGGFYGGVNVASASPSIGNRGQFRAAMDDISFSAPAGDQGHGTHVAGTIGSYGRPAVGVGTPIGNVTFFDSGVSPTGSPKVAAGVSETGIDYSHLDLYKNVWINQDLERVIDDLASDVAGQHASSQRG